MAIIQKILIANRGEIASRIIRTCRKMGIATVAVFSDADAEAPFVREADEGVRLPGNTPTETYLNQDLILEIAKKCSADAIHPGYGFLAENADFASLCEDKGLIFIGPKPESILEMGSKSRAKLRMEKHQVPVVPYRLPEEQSPEKIKMAIEELGFPVLLKAVSGGGGKGMRIVEGPENLDGLIAEATSEAENAFGDKSLLVEKYFPEVRHVEFQIFGDAEGNLLHLFERECSIQRRYQKILEESPSPALSPELRAKMAEAAICAGKAINYQNAGTVEFILTPENEFFFLEMNTRLQVEHPVTEMITGLDLVEWQILVAEGSALPLHQDEIKSSGYAVEVRLYAEDPTKDFQPDAGKISHWKLPELAGLRVESGIKSGSEVSIFYDPMLAKLIVHGPNRAVAHRKMAAVLRNLHCAGIQTNQQLLRKLFAHPNIAKGEYSTQFFKNFPEVLQESEQIILQPELIALTLAAIEKDRKKRALLKGIPVAWRNNPDLLPSRTWQFGESEVEVKYDLKGNSGRFGIEGPEVEVSDFELGQNEVSLEIEGLRRKISCVPKGEKSWLIFPENQAWLEVNEKERNPFPETKKQAGGYESPMPAQVLRILVEPGQAVKDGQGLLVLSSMKMENTICANEDGIVSEIFVEVGENIPAGTQLIDLKTEKA